MAIRELLGKGLALSKADLAEIDAELVQLPHLERWEIQPEICEAIQAIIDNPDYVGDIDASDLEPLEDALL